MRREVIFDVKNNSEYRVVCRFGYADFIDFAWWGHIQKKYYYKKYLFIGERKFRWIEIDRCWWRKDINTMDELNKAAIDFFDEIVLMPIRIKEKAINLK